jgi:biopolymer transport protein ExbB
MKGVEARVLRAGLEANAPDAMEDAIAGTLSFERLKLESSLLFIGTVASNAPFVGLFGTVLGIIKAFNDLAQKTDESATAVMGGISEALVATAVGLLVAIPAVVFYNLLTRQVKTKLSRVESLGSLIISRVRGGA